MKSVLTILLLLVAAVAHAENTNLVITREYAFTNGGCKYLVSVDGQQTPTAIKNDSTAYLVVSPGQHILKMQIQCPNFTNDLNGLVVDTTAIKQVYITTKNNMWGGGHPIVKWEVR
jgi:hypothetical protein